MLLGQLTVVGAATLPIGIITLKAIKAFAAGQTW